MSRMGAQIGRPSKGRRDAILAKPPLEFGAILKSNADAEGLSYGEYLVKLAAERLNMPQYVPARPRNRAEELPINLEEAATRAA
ncbi:hypothetical protein A9Z40_01845 [Microbacterium arborescens]|uniref:Uncharacterized protein n=1 Tax=Microbacterium arborescens TaxID=33883 RepID=A0ABX2WJJ4_9MICO|nr:hypothetical protein [Microbacterium arborescens]OAZ41444.1 hypothetical protein A9Z40_01845 [Microbacterium arborescens]